MIFVCPEKNVDISMVQTLHQHPESWLKVKEAPFQTWLLAKRCIFPHAAVVFCHALFQIQMHFWICNFINFQFLESEQISIHFWPEDNSVQHLNLARRQISSLKSGCYWREEMKVQLIPLPVNQSFEALIKGSFKVKRYVIKQIYII